MCDVKFQMFDKLSLTVVWCVKSRLSTVLSWNLKDYCLRHLFRAIGYDEYLMFIVKEAVVGLLLADYISPNAKGWMYYIGGHELLLSYTLVYSTQLNKKNIWWGFGTKTCAWSISQFHYIKKHCIDHFENYLSVYKHYNLISYRWSPWDRGMIILVCTSSLRSCIIYLIRSAVAGYPCSQTKGPKTLSI